MLEHVDPIAALPDEAVPLGDTANQIENLFTILYLGEPAHNTADSLWQHSPSLKGILDTLTVCDKYLVEWAVLFLERELM